MSPMFKQKVGMTEIYKNQPGKPTTLVVGRKASK